MSALGVIWHDLECGSYAADRPFWRRLAAAAEGSVLDIGAGTGRVALDLAGRGHRVTALDADPELLGELEDRASVRGLQVATVSADARSFSLAERFALIIVPMQTAQLLGGRQGRRALLDRVREHLVAGGLLAIALAEELEPFSVGPGEPGPLPDMRELDGVLYASVPVAIRASETGHLLERRREVTLASGEHTATLDRLLLDRIDAETLEAEGERAGFKPKPREYIDSTTEHVGSTVVMLGA